MSIFFKLTSKFNTVILKLNDTFRVFFSTNNKYNKF